MNHSHRPLPGIGHFDALKDTAEAESGVPLAVRRDLMECAVGNGRISYAWLLRLYKRGQADGQRVQAERDRLRAALAGLVGVDGRGQLEELEAVMRLMPAPAEDKAATIDAIHALIATSVDTVKAEAK